MATLLVTIFVSIAIPCVIAGVVCNAAVVLCILLTPNLRTRTNAIVVNLAASSFLFLLLVAPFLIDSYLNLSWRYAEWYCHLTARLSFWLVGVTINNIAFLGLYRYFCVVHRTRACLHGRKAVFIIILMSWGIPVGLQLLFSFTGWTKSRFIAPYGRCILLKDSSSSGKAYDGLVLGGIILPFAIAVYSYARIIIAVTSSARKIRSHRNNSEHSLNSTSEPDPRPTQAEGYSTYADHTSACSHGAPSATIYHADGSNPDIQLQPLPSTLRNPKENRLQRRRIKRGKISGQEIVLTKICAAMFVLFSVCYGPICMLTILFPSTAFPPDAYTVCTIIYWLGSCLNPVVYATLQTDMRQKLLRIFHNFLCKKRNGIHNLAV